jgi:hypothetical protein
VKLEADTVDWASFLFQSLDHVVDGVTSTTVPSSVSSGMTIIIVEELGMRVSLVCPFESITDEVFHTSIDFTPWGIRSNLVRSTVLNCFIDDIPCPDSTLVSSNGGLDVPLGKIFDFPGVS